jgi:hypothetical protein
VLKPLAHCGAGAGGQLDPGVLGQQSGDDLDRRDAPPTRPGLVMAFGSWQKLHELGPGLQHGLGQR